MERRLAIGCLVVGALLPSCILFVDLDVLGHPGALGTDAAIGGEGGTIGGEDATSGTDGAGPSVDGGRFCDGHRSAAVCEDFDDGRSNPALVWLPELDANGGEMRIVTDASTSPPGSLFVSIAKNREANIKEFLVAIPPRTGSKTTLHLEFRPIRADYILVAFLDCATAPPDDWDGLAINLEPDGTLGLAHDYDKDQKDIGHAPVGVFTTIDVTMSIGTNRITGTTTVGSVSTPFDWPVGCSATGAQRLRIGIEGAGGEATVGFDDVVYDVAP